MKSTKDNTFIQNLVIICFLFILSSKSLIVKPNWLSLMSNKKFRKALFFYDIQVDIIKQRSDKHLGIKQKQK